MKKIRLGLFVKVLIAITLGALLGLVAPDVLVRICTALKVDIGDVCSFQDYH